MAWVGWGIKIYYCTASAFLMYRMVTRYGEEGEKASANNNDPSMGGVGHHYSSKEKLVAFALG